MRARFEATGNTGFFDLDVHLNPQGHAGIAPDLAEFIRQRLRAFEPPPLRHE